MKQHGRLCERVRSSCEFVMDGATLVEIDDARLASLATECTAALSSAGGAPASAARFERARFRPADVPGATLILALDAINFGSGYHDEIRKRPGLSGARTMAQSLRDHVEQTGPLTPQRLRAVDRTECGAIFGQDVDDEAQGELMTLFATALTDLGGFLDARGGTLAVIEAAGRSAENLAETLTEMPFYRDVTDLDGRSISFYKRAQITPADLVRTLELDLFDDLDQLTAFADNLVPHVLRVDGALRYAPSLADQIDSGIPIEPRSRAEVEIRAAGVVAVERLSAFSGFRPMDLDLWLWERGGGARYKAVRRHRTRSVHY